MEYLSVVENEYEIERNKKGSFENRAGIFFALIGAICVYLFDKIKINELVQLLYTPLNIVILLKFIFGCMVYISLSFTLICLIKTITVRQHNNFEVKSIDEVLIAEDRMSALARIIFTYRDIIVQHREINEKRAETFKKSLYGVIIMLIAMVLCISLWE